MQNKAKEMKNSFIKKFRHIMGVIITAGIFLTACGGSVREEAEQESQVEAHLGLQTETQLTEDEITLSDITWDDYNSGNEYETWLHFSFMDGTVVDKELPYCPSIVKKVDYIDITEDGKDEVLIYRYFANTATEYTVVNFFQIEENTVTEISPELELKELADNVWNVVDADFSKEEYDMPVFTMESYVKENMMTYIDKSLLVGYQDGGWQIIEEQIHDYKSDG